MNRTLLLLVLELLFAVPACGVSSYGDDDADDDTATPPPDWQVQLFDDFEYTVSGQVDVRLADNDIFGDNHWCTVVASSCAQPDHLPAPIASRAWYWFTWGEGHQDQILAHLRAETTGVRMTQDDSHSPAVNSGFMAKSGTWVWRVRFDHQPEYVTETEAKKLNNAVWALSPSPWADEHFENEPEPVRTTELDIERNNAFETVDNAGVVGERYLHVTNHGWESDSADKASPGTRLGCVLRFPDSAPDKPVECNDYLSGTADPGAPENEWWEAMIRFDSVNGEVEYALLNRNYGGSGQMVWAGGPTCAMWDDEACTVVPEFGTFAVRDEILPQWPGDDLIAVFSMGAPAGLLDSHSMSIDWLYYSPATDLGFDEISVEVAEIQSTGVPRLNLGGLQLSRGKKASDPIDAAIDGPDVVPGGEQGRLRALVSPRYDRLHYTWESRASSQWHEVGSLPWLSFDMPGDCTVQEFRVTVDSHWYPEEEPKPSEIHRVECP